MSSFERLETDGRVLEVLRAGPAGAMPLIFHVGTPMAATSFEPLERLATARGLRLVTYSRPGYGRSTRQPRHRVADAARDVDATLSWLGADRFVTLGWSGGGPRAIACAAVLADRCLAAASIAGVAPYAAHGLDWLQGMNAGNVAEYSAALRGAEALEAHLQSVAADVAHLETEAVRGWLRRDGTPPDAPLASSFAEFVAASFRHSQASGVFGWLDDDLAEVADWGFDLDAIRRPVAIWHGSADTSVPFAHGRWLAEHIPGARARLRDGHGHFSLPVVMLDSIIDELLALAREAT
ncbi:MAG TPA: alpha/beta fold hydrolase [Candidatus Acidoferrales bacterium]|nr:alpha/beta fold hydrolase [Candidatus Acidoferrales bacterium]